MIPGLLVVMFVLLFAAGAAVMLSSLIPRPGLHTFCVKCAHQLVDTSAGFCPRCRRILTPEMIVTCTRSAINGRRFLLGLGIVAVVAITAAWTLRSAWIGI